ncbi:3-deoxy-D-manno-octulosonic acid transferase [Psychromonas sp. PRT-SC03]|nr:3-deoxy-D-manno-octulosonic acid transferase [Psychromonas sp. PRT-SC03]
MLNIIYSLFYTLLSPLYLYSLYKYKTGKPVIGSRWKEHFGYSPKLKTKKTPLWIHAVSVGEVIAVSPFIKQLKKQHPTLSIVLTTTTSTGAEQALKLGNLIEHRYMPLDFSFAIKRFIKIINPQQLVIMETELWPNTLAITAKNNIPVIILNARLSARSFSRYQKIQWVFNLLAKNIDIILCQSNADAERFIDLGIKKQKIQVTGSIKYDIDIAHSDIIKGEKLKKQIGKRPIWIACSTHEGEDIILLNAHKKLLKTTENALLILVPRHPERFENVLQLALKLNLKTVSHSSQINLSADIEVYLGDTMGEMMALISVANVCFMGGSLLGDKVGGHNLLEPASLGKPILSGPSFYNFKGIGTQLINIQACTLCHNENDICEHLEILLNDIALQKKQGANALQMVEKNKGAIIKSINALEQIISL